MIIIPPDELAYYLTTDENGNWIHSDNMPKDLEEKFKGFVQNAKTAKENALHEQKEN